VLDLWCFVLVSALTNRTYGRCLCLEGDATSDVGSLFAPLLIIFVHSLHFNLKVYCARKNVLV